MKYWVKTPGKLILIQLITMVIVVVLSGCSGSAGVPGPTGQQGPPGVGVKEASINNTGHLVITLSNGQSIDAGNVVGTQPATTSPSGSTAISMADLFSLIQPVIVRIDVTGQGFQGSGSGIIIRNDGYIITNEHVIDAAESIMITLSNDQQHAARVTASDTNIDLAILKLANSPSNLAAATLGSVSDINVGGIVVAAGYPLGSELPGPASFSQGIVSAVRTLDGQKYIQTDVAINPGNSGGALVNRSNAKVIGITNASILNVFNPRDTVVGIGLAIPIDVIQTYIQNNLK
jgi:serine protease Do